MWASVFQERERQDVALAAYKDVFTAILENAGPHRRCLGHGAKYEAQFGTPEAVLEAMALT